jgi:hypothetical protein
MIRIPRRRLRAEVWELRQQVNYLVAQLQGVLNNATAEEASRLSPPVLTVLPGGLAS